MSVLSKALPTGQQSELAHAQRSWPRLEAWCIAGNVLHEVMMVLRETKCLAYVTSFCAAFCTCMTGDVLHCASARLLVGR